MSLNQESKLPYNRQYLKPLKTGANIEVKPFDDPMRQGNFPNKPAKFCCMCGKPMTFSDDPKKSAFEMKHSIHWACKEIAERQCDILAQEVRE